ncbi:MAG: uracil-DNA glycosylase [Sedimentisphaerales bacterium]|nr:uracil-DNA glycosylase [Sedimentisphaerales bacterium]
MRVNKCIGCENFPCDDVNKNCYIIPKISVKPEAIKIIMISEASPKDLSDDFYAKGNPLYAQTTIQAFMDAGAKVTSMKDILDMGIYVTTAIKCGKTGYGIKTDTIKECSFILEKELALFPYVKVFLLMGDVAIKTINYIAKRAGEKRVIPAGSTYKLRGKKYLFQSKRVFPSYLQAGPSFFIEKSKRKMIAEDIAAALKIIKSKG